MKPPLRERAAGRWYGILAQLGIGEEFLTGKHGPCPACGGKDRFRWADSEGSGNYYCNVCNHGDGADLLMKVNCWDFATAAKEIEKIMGDVEFKAPRPKKDPLPRLKRISVESCLVDGGDPASLYLEGRGLTTPPELRYITSLAYYDGRERLGRFAAMLAVIQDSEGNNLTYHATYLQDRKKADVPSPKKIFPPISPISGAFIRLFGDGSDVVIAEGIETAIAAHELTGLPCLAAISASGMESIKLPDHVRSVMIFGDNDHSYAGQKAAYVLANRLTTQEKIPVVVAINNVRGDDFADQWRKQS